MKFSLGFLMSSHILKALPCACALFLAAGALSLNRTQKENHVEDVAIEAVSETASLIRTSAFETKLAGVNRAVDANKSAHNKLEYYCIRPNGMYGQVDFYAYLKPAS
jgi:hypothetical protein